MAKMGVTPNKGGTIPRYSLYFMIHVNDAPGVVKQSTAYIPGDTILGYSFLHNINSTGVSTRCGRLYSCFGQIKGMSWPIMISGLAYDFLHTYRRSQAVHLGELK